MIKLGYAALGPDRRGILASAAAKKKAAGININLWMGLGMLALGLLFLLWWRLRPLHREELPPRE